MKVSPKIGATLLVAVALLASGVVLGLQTYEQVAVTAEARQHATMVMGDADDFLSALKDAETGQRGFLLTGNEAFLAPYLAVHDRLNAQLQALRQKVRVESAKPLIDMLTPLLQAKLAELAQGIEFRRANKSAEMLNLLNAGQGKKQMDAIRAQLQSFNRIEEAHLAAHEAKYQKTMGQMFAFILAASIWGLLAALGFAWVIYRQGLLRLNQQVLEQTRHLLEQQAALNQELKLSNQALQVNSEQLAVTLNSIGDGVITTDAQARITRLNPLAERLTGWTDAQAQGHSIEEVLHIVNKSSRLPVVIPVMAALLHGSVQVLANHTVLLCKDGSEYDIADSCAPIRARDGEVIGAVLVFRDVTEEYAAQQVQRDSTALIQTVLNTVADGILTVHCEGMRLKMLNAQVERMFGYSAAELLDQDIHVLIPALDESPCWIDSMANPSDVDAAYAPCEVVGQRKDASSFALEITFSKMRLGDAVHYTGILRDISARKRSEEALRRADALQSAIFTSANFSSIATDAKGVIQIFNVGAERMLGYTALEVIDKITPADISDPQEMIARAFALSKELGTQIAPGFEALVFKASRGMEDIYELTYIRKDGSRLRAMLSVTALRDDAQAIIGYLLIGTDNTARKQIEEERKKLDQRLRDQQFYTRSLIEANIDAIITTDPSGIITDVNKQMESLTDCTRDELIGAPFKTYFTDPERAEAGINLVLSANKVSNYELTARTRDGLETVVSYNASTFYDRDRKLQGVFAAARDVTERKRLDGVLEDKNVELEAARALAEKANLAKSEFLSSMSHELRSPLNAILGFAQLMESDEPAPSTGQQESIAQILRAGWHLLKLINEILDLSKIEARQIPLSKEAVLLSEILSECQSMVEPHARQRGIEMRFPPGDAALHVLADHTRLKQVLLNLLTNAIKYNSAQGTLEVGCTLQPQNRIRVSIRDTGQGMRPDQQAQLFQAFNRLGQEASGVEGTGIGLVVAKQLVELMGGSIGVQSTVGVGSVFWFELDAVDAPLAALESGHVTLSLPVRPSKAHTLLYVEDNPANMKLVQKIIERHPELRLLMASNGLAGIELARSERPDVILLDINLPGISGFETLRLLREDARTAHIPAVAVSANAMARDVKKGLEAGFMHYLTKPIKVDEFLLALHAALEVSERSKP